MCNAGYNEIPSWKLGKKWQNQTENQGANLEKGGKSKDVLIHMQASGTVTILKF